MSRHLTTPFEAQGASMACHCPGMGEFDGVEMCACSDGEKVIRAYSGGQKLPAMTPDQREWCLAEIDRVEGNSRDHYESEADKGLAHGVLCAWTDFCRDKGLIR